MRRGELYRVYPAGRADPRDFRVFVVLSRQTLIDSTFSSVICAPVYSCFSGLSTQLAVGTAEGLKSDSSIFCDELMSIEKSKLTDFVGSLSAPKLARLTQCLRIAVGTE